MFKKITTNIVKSIFFRSNIVKNNNDYNIKNKKEDVANNIDNKLNDNQDLNVVNTNNQDNKGSVVDNMINHSKFLVNNFILEFDIIKSKLNNLLETNYNQGLWHIERNNLNEAIFRFRFIKKFWPNHYDSWYQLAYCLHKKGKNYQAREILKDLFKNNPEYSNIKAQELFEMLNPSLKKKENKTEIQN
jgi:tetratricopeptide (TPR) repeat protein